MRKRVETKDGKVQIESKFKLYVRNAFPHQYIRYAGIGPYFIPVFGKIFWKRLEVALTLAGKYLCLQETKIKIGDFGCGFGVLVALLSHTFPNFQIIGVDIYPSEVLKVAEHLCNKVSNERNYFFVRVDIQNSSFISEMFDVIFCLDVLEHVRNVAKSIENLKRNLKRMGILIVSVPVDGRLLKIAREIYTLGGRSGENDPHWHGDVKNYHEFEICLSNNFKILESTYVPNRLIAYDKVYVCKNKNGTINERD